MTVSLGSQEDTDAELLANLPSLRAIFVGYSLVDGIDAANRQASTLLSFGEWMRMMKDFALIDSEFTAREASLAFSWSRMRSIDESSGSKKSARARVCVCARERESARAVL